MGLEIRRTHYTTDDPEQAYAALARAYAVRRWRLAQADQFSLHLSTTALGPVTFEASRLHGATGAGTLDFTETIRVGHLVAGRLTLDDGPADFQTSAPFLLPPALYTDRWEHTEIDSVAFDPTAITAHARALAADPALVPRFTGTTPITPHKSRYWTRLLNHIRHDVLDNEAAAASALLLDQTVRSVLTAVLHTFPNTATDTPAPTGQADPVPAAIRRATTFIDTHLAEPIGITEIADAARMSPRGLQAAFRRHQGTTLIAYLRRARLDAAHHELLAIDPTTGITVQEIAARWGFAHSGRFASAYYQAYGISPAHTLHS